jgi:hypothetical protein
MLRVDTSSALRSCPSIGKSRNVPAGKGDPLNVKRYTRHVPQASAESLAATYIAGSPCSTPDSMVTARLNRLLTLSNCTRGSVSRPSCAAAG